MGVIIARVILANGKPKARVRGCWFDRLGADFGFENDNVSILESLLLFAYIFDLTDYDRDNDARQRDGEFKKGVFRVLHSVVLSWVSL